MADRRFNRRAMTEEAFVPFVDQRSTGADLMQIELPPELEPFVDQEVD